jgi:hypothetical protein
MSTQIQRRRGTTAEHSTFTGVEGELTVDTTKDTAVVHDGTTVGGHPLQKQYPPLGSAAAPTYTFTGDTNTGIYSPGADQVAVATNGTGRLFIDASGRVGIGATPWSGAQGLYLGSAGHIYGVGTNSVYYNTNAYFNSGWKYNGNSAAVQFEASGGQFIFNTAPANSSGAGAALTWSERLRITSAGLVGIGTSGPDGLLHVASGSAGTVIANGNADELVVENSSTGGISILTPDANHGYLIFGSPSDNEGAIIRYRHTDGIYTIGTEAAGGSIQLRSGTGTTALTIDSSQRVGIGTTSPVAKLTVVSTSSVNGVNNCTLRSSDNATSSFYIGHGPSGVVNIASDNNIGFGYTNNTTYTERMRLDTSGRLLVGTSTARSTGSLGAGLHQVESANYAVSQLFSNTSTADGSYIGLWKSRGGTVGSTAIVQSGDTTGAIYFGGSDGTNLLTNAIITSEVDGTPGAGDMPGRLVFSTTSDGASSPTERLRIDASGRVGIGVTGPSEKLDVNGAVRVTNESAGWGSGAEGGFIDYYSPASQVRFGHLNGASGSAKNVVCYTGGSEAFRVDSNRRLLVGTSTNTNVASSVGALVQTRFAGSFTNFAAIRESGPAAIVVGRANGSAAQIVANNDILGEIRFAGADGVDLETQAAVIKAEVDGTPGANDMPGRLVFSTTADGASSPTERVRIDSAGRVGIGTTTPSDFNSSGNNLVISGTGNVGITIDGTSTTQSNIYFADGPTGSEAYRGYISYDHNNDSMRFGSAAVERARIDSSGRLLVGASTAGAGIGFGVTLTVDSASDTAIFKTSAGNQAQCLYLWNAATTTNNAFLAFGTETTYTFRGGITYNRAGGLVAYSTTSDYRAKDISGPVQKPGATIDALKVYEGKMKGATQSRPMLIAHEVQEHAPYAVIGEKDALKKDGTPEFQQMDVSALVPLLLAEIQSLRQRVATLESA